MDSLIDAAESEVAAPVAEPSAEVAAILAAAADLARQAIIEYSGETVGAYLGMSADDDAAATHRFLATLPGYHGWQWAVVVASYPGADCATISEVVLVPGPTALLAPPWVPWEQRVEPGDLGPGDLLAPLPDDPRLVPGFLATGDPLIDDTAVEVGFGRRRVLSAFGREDAAQRWHDGDQGPASPMARSTKRVCRDCGFMVPLAGALGAMFGVCCNALSADGRVVDYFYGCGAHSDTPAPAGAGSPAYEPYDDGVLEVVEVVEATKAVREPESVVSEQVVSEQSDVGEVEPVGVDIVAAAPETEPGEELVAEAELEPVGVAEDEPAPDVEADLEAESVSDPEA
jgi:hypothetical protein